MTIIKAVQNGKVVEIFDENENKVFEKEGELYEFKSPTVRVKTSEDTIDAIWAEEKEIREKTEHIVEVEFEYKGVKIRGYSIFSVKDYCGATMTSPVNGIKTLDNYHIPGHAHWGNNEESIKNKTIESLKKSYDEYLLLLSKKEEVAGIVNAPYPLRKSLKGCKEELASILNFVKKYENKNRLSEYDYHTFTFRLEKEIERYAKMIENDYRVSFYEKFSIIKNFNDVAKMIANKHEE